MRQASRSALSLGPQSARLLEQMSTPDGRIFSAWLAAHLAVWAAGVAGVIVLQGQPLVQWLIGAVLGSQLHALTILQHDCGHRSAFRSATANLWTGRVLAWFIVMPFTTFTELHRRHHGFTGDNRHDPDEWFYAGGARQLFLRECLFVPRFIWLSLTRLGADVRRRAAAELAFNLLTHSALIAALAVAGAFEVLTFAYLLPMAWLALVFNPISRGYEHYPMAGLAHDDPRRTDLRFNTITVPSRLIGLAWANIGFHVEHHMYPRVPFHRLPQLHRLFHGKVYRLAPYPLHRLGEACTAREPS